MRSHAQMEPLKESFWKLERKEDEESDSNASADECQIDTKGVEKSKKNN